MTGPDDGRRSETAPASREAAQRRADRVAAFREELAELEREEVLALTPEQRAAVSGHHDHLLERLARAFDVDRTQRQRRLSAGMKAATLLGAVTLAAAVYTFLDRFWGGMPVALQASVVVALPLFLVAGMEVSARREGTLYVTLLLGLLAGAAFVIGTNVLAALLGVALPPEALLAWAAFCGALAGGFRLKTLLAAALVALLAWAGTLAGPTDGCVWDAFGHRPETFLPLGALFFALPLASRRRFLEAFGPTFRTFGLVALLVPVLILGRAGNASFLALDPGTVEAGYQLLGFLLAALAVAAGVKRVWPEATGLGSAAFVLSLYLKIYDWWWTVLPRWVFFLVLGLVAVAALLVLRRLHAVARRAAS